MGGGDGSVMWPCKEAPRFLMVREGRSVSRGRPYLDFETQVAEARNEVDTEVSEEDLLQEARLRPFLLPGLVGHLAGVRLGGRGMAVP